jgi:hypothetical protein
MVEIIGVRRCVHHLALIVHNVESALAGDSALRAAAAGTCPRAGRLHAGRRGGHTIGTERFVLAARDDGWWLHVDAT